MAAAAAAAGAAQGSYQVPDHDLASYLQGTWRRSLEAMAFGGGFGALAPSNSFAVISADVDAAPEPNTRFLDWKFTPAASLEQAQLQTWIRLQFIPMADGRTQLEWVWKAPSAAPDAAKGDALQCHICGGVFDPAAAVFTLNFDAPGQSVTYTFKLIDPATMAVCVVAATANEAPTIQYGHMIRLER